MSLGTQSFHELLGPSYRPMTDKRGLEAAVGQRNLIENVKLRESPGGQYFKRPIRLRFDPGHDDSPQNCP